MATRELSDLYRNELDAWTTQGVVDVRPAFSAAPVEGVTFVQDRLWADRHDVAKLTRDRGATFYVSGDGQHMAPAVWNTCVQMYREGSGADESAAEAWLTTMQREHSRYVADVFS